jgi:hypothetical protein
VSTSATEGLATLWKETTVRERWSEELGAWIPDEQDELWSLLREEPQNAVDVYVEPRFPPMQARGTGWADPPSVETADRDHIVQGYGMNDVPTSVLEEWLPSSANPQTSAFFGLDRSKPFLPVPPRETLRSRLRDLIQRLFSR